MGFALFVASMVALALMSTTKESRDQAYREAIARGDHKRWRLIGLIAWGLVFSFVLF